MKHETWTVTVVTLIPVLAIAAGFELRALFDRIENNAKDKDLSPEAMLFFFQALATGALLLCVPSLLSDLYNNRDTSSSFVRFVTATLQVDVTLLAIGPAVDGFRTWRQSEHDKPRPKPKKRPEPDAVPEAATGAEKPRKSAD